MHVFAVSDILLLTDGNSKSFWLTRLRTYSIRYRFSGHANCTGGVRVLIAVTMVCHKHTNPNKIRLSLDDRKAIFEYSKYSRTHCLLICVNNSINPSESIWRNFGGVVYKHDMNTTTTYLNSLFNIILDVLNFLLLLSETDTQVQWQSY